MALVRWSPVRDLLDIREEMDRLFEDFFSESLKRRTDGFWSPRVDISERDDEILLTAELPGVSRDDIKVTLQDNVLTLKGEKREERERKDKKHHVLERAYGSFQRSFTLPACVETDKITASYKDGLLKIRLPKTEEAKAKEIKIEVN